MKNEDSQGPGEDFSFEEKDRIWNLIYQKISESIERRQNFAVLFSGNLKEGESEEGYSAIITDDQYEVLLYSFLSWSEEQEKYETCTKVNKLIKELESWKKKN